MAEINSMEPALERDPQKPLEGGISTTEFVDAIKSVPGPESGGKFLSDPKNASVVVHQPVSNPIFIDDNVPGVSETIVKLSCYEFHYYDLVCGSTKVTGFYGGYWEGGIIKLINEKCSDGPEGSNTNIQAKVIPGNGTDDCYSILVTKKGSACIPKNGSGNSSCPSISGKPNIPGQVINSPTPTTNGVASNSSNPSNSPVNPPPIAIEDFPVNRSNDIEITEISTGLSPGKIVIPTRPGENVRITKTQRLDGSIQVVFGKQKITSIDALPNEEQIIQYDNIPYAILEASIDNLVATDIVSSFSLSELEFYDYGAHTKGIQVASDPTFDSDIVVKKLYGSLDENGAPIYNIKTYKYEGSIKKSEDNFSSDEYDKYMDQFKPIDDQTNFFNPPKDLIQRHEILNIIDNLYPKEFIF